MSQSPGSLSRFWKEMKRRKVLRSLAIYAGTAFIIPEAIEEAYEIHDPNLPYLTIKLSFTEPLYTNPRFIAVVENMGLTIPER